MYWAMHKALVIITWVIAGHYVDLTVEGERVKSTMIDARIVDGLVDLFSINRFHQPLPKNNFISLKKASMVLFYTFFRFII